MSRERRLISFTFDALDRVDMFLVNIRNACLQTPTSEKNYVTCSLDLGLENLRKRAITWREMCSIKYTSQGFRNHLRSYVTHLDFKPCLAGPDVCARLVFKSDRN